MNTSAAIPTSWSNGNKRVDVYCVDWEVVSIMNYQFHVYTTRSRWFDTRPEAKRFLDLAREESAIGEYYTIKCYSVEVR